jgi:hypothetical protein
MLLPAAFFFFVYITRNIWSSGISKLASGKLDLLLLVDYSIEQLKFL